MEAESAGNVAQKSERECCTIEALLNAARRSGAVPMPAFSGSTDMAFLSALFVVVVASLALIKVFRRFTKAELENIPGPPAESFIRGVFPKYFNANGWAYHRYLWGTYGAVIRLKGMFGENALYVHDPKALHHIFVKDQHIFLQSPTVAAAYGLFFGPGLLGSAGKRHKKQRQLLNPAFSTGNMRQMTPMIYDVIHKMESSVMAQLNNGEKEVDMLSWMTRTTLEIIGQCGFGHSFDDLGGKYIDNPFSSNLGQIVPVSLKLVFLRLYALHHLIKIGSPAFRRLMIAISPFPALREARDIADSLHRSALEIFEVKRKALFDGDKETTQQFTQGRDILSILMKLNMEAPEEDKISDEELYGQIATFTFAGMDTTANALGRALWALANHPSAQKRIRAEIRQALQEAGGDIPYDTLMALPYLDAICRETLRLYPVAWQMIRKPTEDIMLPLSRPVKGLDGSDINEVFVPKGATVFCGIQGSNMNVETWGPDAHEWKPERWFDLPKTLTSAEIPGIYSNLLTFSAGNRACIGYKLSQLEMKAILAVVINRFEFQPSQEIFWRMTSIVTPVPAQGNQIHPKLPLMVKLASD
ncbi:hypothetical protein CVT24_010715 [Panaeolus cyanescens]|uniref:Cytochrome P450 n=1 Tax=Panaeolus cyanescens TaxID=181874 RepID=A0A409YMA8_9AGAR|nr:hypothetical protein CVT24_010715 [Panaeolus cyanescens]